jgi:3D (Asp-Asp-Asp) domain-containing protein
VKSAIRVNQRGDTMLIEAILLGTLTATSYRAVPEQTKPECTSRNHCRTANNENVSELGVAVSQDYLDAGTIRYGDCLYIDGVGFRLVNDCLNRRYTKRVDVFVYTRAEEQKFGVRKLKVWLIKASPKTKIAGGK